METQLIPRRLDTLCSDIILQIGLALELDDLSSLALTCKNIYSTLCCSGVQKHWVMHLPPALLPIQAQDSSSYDQKLAQDAVRRIRSLRSAWADRKCCQPKNHIEVRDNHWNLHVPHTRWMFTFGTSGAEDHLRCIDLVTGNAVGETVLGFRHPSPKLLTGQIHGDNQVLLSYPSDVVGEDGRTVWGLNLILVGFLVSDSGDIRAEFTTLKTLCISADLAQLFTRFDVIQMEGNYIVMSGNWVSRHFLLIDWSTGIMATHSCSKLWKTFDWKLINGSLILAYDDRQVSSVNVSEALASSLRQDNAEQVTSASLFTMPLKGCIEFVKRDHQSFCAMIVTTDPHSLSYDFKAMRIMVGDDGTFSSSPDLFNKLELRPRFPELCEDGLLPLYVGSCVVFLDDFGLTVYFSDGSSTIRQKTFMLSNPILGIVEVDEEIGMIAVRESDGRSAYTRVYWIA